MDEQVIEAIAAKVHDAWAAEKQRQGFADHVFFVDILDNPETATICRETGCRTPREKHHPDMLPYTALAENVQEYDRVTARAALAGIDAAGYSLVPKLATAGGPA